MHSNEESLFRDLSGEIGLMPVVDTHEHLITESMRLEENADFIATVTTHYLSSDLMSAGMTVQQMETLRGGKASIDEKADILMPFWEKTSNTAYCRALAIAARDLYGADEITKSTLPEIDRRMSERNKPGLYKEVLQDMGRIKYCLHDQLYTHNSEKDDFFLLSLRLDDVVFINSADDIESLEQKYNVSINRIEAIEEILEIRITEHKTRGIVAINSALAYERTLDFKHVHRAEADLALAHILRNRFTERDAKTLQDYMMFSLAQKAYWHNLTMQIHTGLQEGNGNYIMNADPALLTSLIIHNPHTRFALLHGGYPYGGEIAVMAKMFPNVWLDMAWLHVISPVYARNYMAEWLETVPAVKLLGFGGDYCFLEGVYGHLAIAKENIARTLAAKVADSVFPMGDALRYAEMILWRNADALFKAVHI